MTVQKNRAGKHLLVVSGLLLLSGCAVPLTGSDDAEAVDSRLIQLQPDAQLTDLEPVEIKDIGSARTDSLAARTDAVIAEEAAKAVRLNTEDLQRQIADANVDMADRAK